MWTRELDYELPAERIATVPVEPRDAARLFVIRREGNQVEHRHVRDLADDASLINAGDLLVFNRSKVIPARFEGTRRGTGGRVRGLYLCRDGDNDHDWRVMLESRGRLQPGEIVTLDDRARLVLVERHEGGVWSARLDATESTLDLLDRLGVTPLPPYIQAQRRQREQPAVNEDDQQRYNTVYADAPGSIAAPTAGLHFTPTLLKRLTDRGVRRAFVTLHVGLGTFAPIRTDHVEDHRMHQETLHIPAETIGALQDTRRAGGRIIPVGSTSVRAMESLPDPLPDDAGDHGFTTDTDLFIMPGRFRFRFTDALMTNFHLPRSTLLALVAALPGVGVDRLLDWYRQAVDAGYRFYSYGDAMLIL